MLIASLLLAVSLSAGACELTCGLAMHHQTGESAQAGMQQHCTAMQTGPDRITVRDHCAHRMCALPPISLPSDRVGLASPERADSVLAVVAMGIAPTLPHAASRSKEAPPLRAPLLVSLQTTLRV